MLRLRQVCLRAALLGLICLSTLVTPGPAVAEPAADLETLQAAYSDLLDLFYRPLSAPDLLQFGWAGLQSGAQRRGASVPAPLPPLPDDRQEAFDIFAQAYTEYVSSQASAVETAAVADVASGMAEGLHEAHTHYLSPALTQRFLRSVAGDQQGTGLGVQLSNDSAGLITEVAPNGPAVRAGIKPGDVIVAADGRDLTAKESSQFSAELAGSDGTPIALTVEQADGRSTISVTRGTYYFPPIASRMVSDAVGYIRLTDFVISGTTLPDGSEVLAELDRHLDALEAQGARGLILDLRNNGGGSVQTADELLGRFLPDTNRSVHEFDLRGHGTYELASGRVRANQLPLAVLINRGSASASEITVGALRDAGRAILVGQRTAGVLASSQFYPLPGGGGLLIAVAAATTADSGTEIDGIGVEPDVVTAEPRTPADYRAGRDPQVDTAIDALHRAPTPPTLAPHVPVLSAAELDYLLAGGLPAEVPTNDRLTSGARWQRLTFTHPNQWIDQNLGAADPIAIQTALRTRGYIGSVLATYGHAPGDMPAASVTLDLYETADGAHAAVMSNDMPQLLSPIDPPAVIGEETVAYRGSWLGSGTTLISWRRGRVILTAAYSDVPGFDRPDTLLAVVHQADALAPQLTP